MSLNILLPAFLGACAHLPAPESPEDPSLKAIADGIAELNLLIERTPVGREPSLDKSVELPGSQQERSQRIGFSIGDSNEVPVAVAAVSITPEECIVHTFSWNVTTNEFVPNINVRSGTDSFTVATNQGAIACLSESEFDLCWKGQTLEDLSELDISKSVAYKGPEGTTRIKSEIDQLCARFEEFLN